jgi:hypothetical protein
MKVVIARLLWPTVGLALFAAWRFADRWEARGLPKRARIMRAAVVLVSAYPLFWAFREVYRSLGTNATLLTAGGAVIAVSLSLASIAIGKWGRARTAAGLPGHREAVWGLLLLFLCAILLTVHLFNS